MKLDLSTITEREKVLVSLMAPAAICRFLMTGGIPREIAAKMVANRDLIAATIFDLLEASQLDMVWEKKDVHISAFDIALQAFLNPTPEAPAAVVP